MNIGNSPAPPFNKLNWSLYSPPALWDWALPFNIYQKGSTFIVDPTFNLQTYAAIVVVKTYYLNTVSGADANDGLTAATPKKTWNNIIGIGDADRIIIQNGSYLIRGESSLAPNRNTEIIGEGNVYFTSDRSSNVGVWSLVPAMAFTYQANIAGGEYIASVYDSNSTDAFGFPSIYTPVASIAACEALAGSYYWVGGVLYVHALNGLTPAGQANLKYYDSSPIYWARDRRFYFENINFLGGVTMRNASAVGSNVYFKNCSFALGNNAFHGNNELFLFNCIFKKSPLGDNINYDILNTVNTKAIEYNCESYNCGTGATDQCSTSHNNCRVVRINSNYHNSTGQNIADVGTTMTLNLGIVMYSSTSGISIYTSFRQWLDSCVSHSNATDLNNIIGATTYIRNFIGSGVNMIAGTLTPY